MDHMRWSCGLHLVATMVFASACHSAQPGAGLGDGGTVATDSGASDTGTSIDAGASGDSGEADPGCVVTPSADPDVVATRRGNVRGQASPQSIAFLGIPYAEPPVGPLRWTAPVAHGCWTEVRDGTAYGSRCAQRAPAGNFIGDEDCLFLNVWTPAVKSPRSQKLPVMFFIHGGANVIGSADEGASAVFGNLANDAGNLYDGQSMTESRQVVVVSANYRLGALGFLTHPALAAQSATGTSGNYAYLDLILALKWVRENIEAFGGDPSRVMVFGESAGGMATCMLLVSPLAKGLFSSALMESGSCVAPTTGSRASEGQKLAMDVGCAMEADIAACLRAKPAQDLFSLPVESVNFFNYQKDISRLWELDWGANVDGYLLPDAPITLLRQGRHNHVPFALGTNADEAELFLPAVINTCADFAADMVMRFGASLASEILKRYPCLTTVPRWAEVAVITDLAFKCPARRVARAVASSQTEPVYRYQYTHIYRTSALAAMRAFHASELPFVFGSFAQMVYLPTSGEQTLSTNIQGYWSRLSATGDPNGDGAFAWPVYALDRELSLSLDEDLGVDEKLSASECDFWDQLAE
jgi:para-nitrobenzyl esterase